MTQVTFPRKCSDGRTLGWSDPIARLLPAHFCLASHVMCRPEVDLRGFHLSALFCLRLFVRDGLLPRPALQG
jgi:hypothetical protein